MKVNNKIVTLKNGDTIELREAGIEDAKEYLAVSTVCAENSEFIPYGKGEFDHSVEEYEKNIQEYITKENSILILAICNKRIIGAIDVNGYAPKIMSHAAWMGIGMLEECQGLGVGKALMQAALDWARNSSPLELISLTVFSSHKNGIALYEKMGFRECGRLKDFFRKEDNTYDDEITMSISLKK